MKTVAIITITILTLTGCGSPEENQAYLPVSACVPERTSITVCDSDPRQCNKIANCCFGSLGSETDLNSDGIPEEDVGCDSFFNN